jgi:centrin-1
MSKPAAKDTRSVSKSASTKAVPTKAIPPKDDLEELRNAFEIFDVNGNGKVDVKELKYTLEQLGYDTKNPAIYKLIAEFDTPERMKKGGLDFDSFVNVIDTKLGDKDSKDGLKKIYELFSDDGTSGTITIDSLKKIANELGENMSHEELKDLIEKATDGGFELKFEEFYEVMTRKI